ncbi:MAG: cation-transporting P-type ATPase [archaeon]|jgi:Ca2+-transporting ATPase
MHFNGLSSKEVNEKLLHYGANEIRELMHVSVWKILFRQISSNYILYLLFIAMILSFFVGKTITSFTIGAIIVIVVGLGFFQEYRAETAIKSLKTMIVSSSIVIRNGKQIEVLTRELVPGDIVLLRAGEKVPADCVLREANNLKVNESILTGEGKEITKESVAQGENPKEINKLFMGTLIVSGKAIAEVTHTGMNTEFGKIAGLISTAEKTLPLRDKVNKIAQIMVGIGIIVSLSTGAILFFGAKEITAPVLIEILIVVIAVAVSSFPEGLPIVLTTTLALGAKRMAQKNAIVNRMSIIETLGETTVVCSDKTGTITKGEMTVKTIITASETIEVTGLGYDLHGELLLDGKKISNNHNAALKELIKASVICNDTTIDRTGEDSIFEVHGTPTEGALLVMAAKSGMYKEDFKGERVEEVPFTSEKKSMIVLYKEENEFTAYQNGAPDILINSCEYLQKGQSIIKFSQEMKNHFLEKQAMLAKKGYRVICFSYAKAKTLRPEGKVKELIFLGLVGMEDPPRNEAIESIKACLSAGIKVKMITGDYKETAIAIAKQVGLVGKVMQGNEIDELNDTELSEVVQGITIFARVRPEHKLRIVRALKLKGEIVTMTGDGVNDAPALKEAHIGVAMGKNGTDVSRESSDLILKDDNFSTIVSAIEEGRTTYSNIRKFVAYQLSCVIGEIIIIFFGLLIGLPLPLLALQILFMNIIVDDFPAITLGLNPASKDAMRAKPRKNSSLIDKESILFIVISALVMGIVSLAVFWTSLNIMQNTLEISRTITLVTLIFLQLVNAFCFRSFRFGVHELPLNSNKYLLWTTIASLVTTAVVIYTPLNILFEVTPISPVFWLFAGIVSLVLIISSDLLKKIRLSEENRELLKEKFC